MANIAVRLLGSVEMRDAQGRELHSLPSQRKRFVFLSYLTVAQPRRFHSRDKLFALFWPEASHEQARHALNQTLHVLRSELGEEVIRSRGDSDVAIDEAAISCDAVEFEQAVEDGEYEKALELYRGDLMEGLFVREAPEFERWLEDERTRLREKAAGAAWALAHEHVKADRLVDAERTAQRALLLVPTDESEVRRFIQALADAGDRAAAVRFYEKFSDRLRSQYEIEPDPATAAVAAALTKAPASSEAVTAAPARHIAASDGMTVAGPRTSAVPIMQSRKVRIGVGVAAIVTVALGTQVLLSRSTAGRLDPNRVLVVEFTDNSGREDAAVLGSWTQDYIIQILNDAGFAEVVDPVTAQAVSQNVAADETEGGRGQILALAEEARAGTVVSGRYYAAGDSIFIQARITRAGRLLETVGTAGPLSTRSELLARLAQEVVAALATLLDQDIGPWEPTVQPASYEAYQSYREGLEAYVRAGTSNWAEAARHFEGAAVADPAFHRATLWAGQSYSLVGAINHNWAMVLKAESLLAPLREFPEQLSRYERCKLDLVTSIAWRPSLAGQYRADRCMAQEAPGSDEAKYELAGTLMRLNRPAEAIRLYRELDPDRGLMRSNAIYSMYLCIAYHMLGDYEGQLESAQQAMRRFPGSTADFLWLEASALAALGHLDDLAAMLDSVRSSPSPDDLGERLVGVAEELRAHGHRDQAREVSDEAIAWFQPRLPERRSGLGVALYNAERWDDAEQLFRELSEERPEDWDVLSMLGLLAARRGDRAEVARITELHRSSTSPFTRRHTLFRARIAALLGEQEEAMTFLQQWIDLGESPNVYVRVHRDIDFESLHDYPEFQEFMRPKG